MNINMCKGSACSRRNFLRNTAICVAAAPLAKTAFAAEPKPPPAADAEHATNTDFASLKGDANGAPHPSSSAYAKKFSGKYAHRVINSGIGHNLPQQAPQAFAKAIMEVDTF